MKRILIFWAFSSWSLVSIAQCGKSVIYKSDRADFVDSAGNNLHKKEGKITVRLTNTAFVLVHNDNDDDALRGDVKNLICEWKEAYKNGKSTFESVLVEKNGEKNNARVSIEGKEGKLLILVNIKARGMILKIIPKSYTEIKK